MHVDGSIARPAMKTSDYSTSQQPPLTTEAADTSTGEAGRPLSFQSRPMEPPTPVPPPQHTRSLSSEPCTIAAANSPRASPVPSPIAALPPSTDASELPCQPQPSSAVNGTTSNQPHSSVHPPEAAAAAAAPSVLVSASEGSSTSDFTASQPMRCQTEEEKQAGVQGGATGEEVVASCESEAAQAVEGGLEAMHAGLEPPPPQQQGVQPQKSGQLGQPAEEAAAEAAPRVVVEGGQEQEGPAACTLAALEQGQREEQQQPHSHREEGGHQDAHPYQQQQHQEDKAGVGETKEEEQEQQQQQHQEAKESYEQAADEAEREELEEERRQQQQHAEPLKERHGSPSKLTGCGLLRSQQRSFSGDPDYEIPRGLLSETQVLMIHQERRRLRLDPYGFVIPVQDPDAGGNDGHATSGSDGGNTARRTSGAAASTSGRDDDSTHRHHHQHPRRQPLLRRLWMRKQQQPKPQAQQQPNLQLQQQPHRQHPYTYPQEQQQRQQQALERLRKWRKMLGTGGAALEAYGQRRPEKLKRRVRKGVPEQLRGLAWLVLSGGRKLMAANPGTFAALAAEETAAPAGPSTTRTRGAAAATSAAATAGEPSGRPGPASQGETMAATSSEDAAAGGGATGTTDVASAGLHAGSDSSQQARSAPTSTPDAPGPAPAPSYPRLDPSVDACIMRDLNRTFPTHIFFMERQGPGQRALYTVLRAYALYDTSVGYVQGMGFIAAVLLLYLDAEEAFWTLVAIMQGPLGVAGGEGLKRLYLPGMPGLQCCLYQFKYLLHDAAPRLAARMEREGVDPALYATHWFNTAFAYTLPFGYLLRVWDVFLAEGIKTLFRVGLAVLQHAEPRLVRLPFESLLSALSAKNLAALLPPDPQQLMRRALRIRVSRRLGELREEWEALQQQQQGQGQQPAGGGR
ncbi:hypothetical protein Agub_g6994 [Astrephomene gubernaculifera]|uniref:Rab-GAP TBC domain-containing protein n=1 Tax=Astrephomene gubernaculifera TaxID=47775 RepID=A0AAD3DPT0_9CHLO|nr:hypothetical protein Agub_g6994 [Astrephomene gubernaculifera]